MEYIMQRLKICHILNVTFLCFILQHLYLSPYLLVIYLMYHIGFQQILKLLRDIYYEHRIFLYIPFAFTNFDAVYGLSSTGCALEIFRERGRIYGKDKMLAWKFIYMIYNVNLKIKFLLKQILQSCWPSCWRRVVKMRIPSYLEKIS